MRHQPHGFLRREDGQRYTVDGIGAMCRLLRWYQRATGGPTSGPGLRVKGAIDTYRADLASIHKVQALFGRKSVQTTEIFLKGL